MAHANWVAKFDGMDPDDRDRNPLEDALRTESSPFLISRQRYNQVLRRRGGRLPREGLDDLYEAAVLRDMEALKIVRGLPQSPMVPCVRRLSTVSSALHLGDTAFIAALLGVEADDVQSVAGLLRSTGYACLSNFAHSHLGPRRVLFGAVGVVPAEMVPADVLPIAVPAALLNLVGGITLECAVCLQTMQEPTTLGCGHSFCRGCLCRMHVQVCPTCRVPFEDPEALPVSIILRDAVARVDEIRAWIAANTNIAADAPLHAPPAPIAGVDAAEAVAVPAPRVAFDLQTSVLSLSAMQREALALNPAEVLKLSKIKLGDDERDCQAVTAAFGEAGSKPTHIFFPSQIVTLLRRAGVLAEDQSVSEYSAPWGIPELMERYLTEYIRGIQWRMQYVHNSTVTAKEAAAAIPYGKKLMGFGVSTVRDVWTPSLLALLRQQHPTLRLTPEGLSVLHDLVTDVMLRVLARVTDMQNEYYNAHSCAEDCPSGPLGEYCVVNAGPEGGDGRLDATQSIRLFFENSGQLNGRLYLEAPQRCTREKDIFAALRYIFSGMLITVAVKEAAEALEKFCSRLPDALDGNMDPLRTCLAKSTFQPEHVALMAERVRNISMTTKAALVLAAVMEYLSAEIIELAGDNAKNGGHTYITPRHIMLVIHDDDELKATFRHCVFRGAGVRPAISRVIRPVCLATDEPTFLETMVTMAMAARSEEMVQAGTMPTFVDPRTGFHYVVKAPADGDDSVIAVPCPVLDDLSRETREERQRKAAAALPAAVAKQMKEEGYRLRFKESYKKDDFEFSDEKVDGDDMDDGWAKETLQHAHRRRLEEIEVAQADTRFAFEIIPFADLVHQMLLQENKTSLTFTAEAMEVLQTCTEAHVVDMIRFAYDRALKHSPILTGCDPEKIAGY